MTTCLLRVISLTAIALVSISGCSPGGPETIPVYGVVSFIGRDVPKVCRIYFRLAETQGPSHPSMAQADPDGHYRVKAFRNSDGLVPGTYQIQISYYDLKPGANPGLDTSWVEQSYDAGELEVDAGSDGIEHNIEVPRKS